jgi:magnesium transporter
MLNILFKGANAPQTVVATPDWVMPADAIWIDLHNPTREEELAAEAALGLLLPTREEMAEIETSSRLYREGDAVFMTAQLITRSGGETPISAPVTFVLAGQRLITIRYVEPMAFKLVAEQIARNPQDLACGGALLLALLDEIIDRLADTLEHAVAEVELMAGVIFKQQGKIDFRNIMRQLGKAQGVNAKVRESSASLTRLLIFCATAHEIDKMEGGTEHLQVLQRDLASLTDHSGYLAGNTTFLLDAALGMINIEQNAIIKIFSIGAVIFLPPTLIASYFGMNFKHMAIFDWTWGEPLALAMMVLSLVIALVWFRIKGWF